MPLIYAFVCLNYFGFWEAKDGKKAFMIRGADSLKGNKSVTISDRDLPVSLRTFIVCSTSGLLVKGKDP